MSQTHKASPVQASEDALVKHYSVDIDRLLQRADGDDARQLKALKAQLAVGYDDRLIDRFERLTARMATAPLGYLMDTPSGDRLKQEAQGRLQSAHQTVNALTRQLAASTQQAQRLQHAQALRAALSQHRKAWQANLRYNPSDTQHTAPGALLAAQLDQHIKALTAAPTPTHTADTQAADARRDAAILELMRLRLERVPDQGAPQQATDFEALDKALEQAAISAGSAQQEAHQSTDAQRPSSDLRQALLDLMQRRVDIHRRRMDTGQLSDAALAISHDSMVQDLQRAQANTTEPDLAAFEALNAALLADAQSLQSDRSLNAQARAALGTAMDEALAQAQQLRSSTAAAAQLKDALKKSAQVAGDQMDVQTGRVATLDAQRAQAEAQSDVVPASPDLEAAAAQGARRSATRNVTAALADRLWHRRKTRTFSSLPHMTAQRVLAPDESGTLQTFDEAFEGQDSARGPKESMWGQVHRRLGSMASKPGSPAPGGPGLARLGNLIERSATTMARQLAQSAAAAPKAPSRAARAPRPIAQTELATPRLAGLPGNVFADLSSSRMRGVYMPALARVTGRNRAQRPRAEKLPDIHDREMSAVVDDMADPRAIYAALLGEVGEKLWEEQPEVAHRLQASFKPVAAVLPKAGAQGFEPMRRYTEQMRRKVETWIGGGSRDGVERSRHQPVLTPEGGSARSIGDYIGGPFKLDIRGAGEATGDLVRQQAEEVERKLLSERTAIDQGLLSKVSRLIGRKPTRQVEAYSGPTAAMIAQEMGARAFTIGSAMFLPTDSKQAKLTPTVAHEMVHAIDANTDDHPRKIEDEERVAYGVQGVFEQGQKAVAKALSQAETRMELAKEQNIPAMTMPNEPGGTSGTSDPDPGRRSASPKDQALKEEQIREAVTDAVIDLINQESMLESERFGGF